MIAEAISKPRLSWRLWNDPAVRTVIPLFIVLRIVTMLVAYWTVTTFPPPVNWSPQEARLLQGIASDPQDPTGVWIVPWYRWDTPWYLYIADSGYSAGDGSIIYPPLYPFLIRWLAVPLGEKYLVAALTISNLACLVALVLFYKIVEEDFDGQTARHALILYLVFPSAFFLLAGYTESLFMALLLGAWFAAKHQKWLLAGVLALLSSLTRTPGWILVFPLAYIAYIEPTRNLPEHRRSVREFFRRLPAVIGGPLGVAIYLIAMPLAGLGYVNDVYRDWWFVRIVTPWESILHAIQVILSGNTTFTDLISYGTLLFLVVLSIFATKYLKPVYWLYCWPTLAYILMRIYDPPEFYQPTQFIGLIRYALTFFPAFIILAVLLQNNAPSTRKIRLLYLILASGLQIIQLVMFVEGLWVA